MGDSNLSLIWEQDGSKLWIHMPPGEAWFQTRLVVSIDEPISHCVAPLAEHDLECRWQSLLCEDPQCLGPTSRYHHVVRKVFGALMYRVETIFENLRIMNKDFGVVIEMLRSDFRNEDFDVPERSWFLNRVDVHTTNVWIPRGGGKHGTI